MAISAAQIKKYALDPNLSYKQKVALARKHGVSLGQISKATGLNLKDLSKQARNEIGVSSAADLLKGAQSGQFSPQQAVDLAYGIGGAPEERMSIMRQAAPLLESLRPWEQSGKPSLVGGRQSAGALDQLIRGDIDPSLAMGNMLNPMRQFRSAGPNSLEERVGQNQWQSVSGRPFGSSGMDPNTGLHYQTTAPPWAPWAGAPSYGGPINWGGANPSYRDSSWPPQNPPGGAGSGAGQGGGTATPGGYSLQNEIPRLPWQYGAMFGSPGLGGYTMPTLGGAGNPFAGLFGQGGGGPMAGTGAVANPNMGMQGLTGGGLLMGAPDMGSSSASGSRSVPGFPGVNVRPGMPTPQQLLPGPVTGPGQLGGAPLTDAKMLQLVHGTLPVTDLADKWLEPLQNEVTRDITRAYQQNVLPSIGRNSVAMGNYGSSRHGIAEGLAAQGMNDAIGRELAGLRANTYERGLDRSLQATGQLNQNELQRQQMAMQGQLASLGMLPQIQDAQFRGLNQVAGIGDAWQNLTQQRMNADRQQWDYWQNLPYQQLANYMSMIQGNVGQLGGTTTMNQQGGGGFNPAGALGGAATGAGLGAGLAGGMGALAATGWGLPLALIGGGLMGGF